MSRPNGKRSMNAALLGTDAEVARIAVGLAQAMVVPIRHIVNPRWAALVHDLGKVAIDSRLWGALGSLHVEQHALMEAHARLGYQLAARSCLSQCSSASSTSTSVGTEMAIRTTARGR